MSLCVAYEEPTCAKPDHCKLADSPKYGRTRTMTVERLPGTPSIPLTASVPPQHALRKSCVSPPLHGQYICPYLQNSSSDPWS